MIRGSSIYSFDQQHQRSNPTVGTTEGAIAHEVKCSTRLAPIAEAVQARAARRGGCISEASFHSPMKHFIRMKADGHSHPFGVVFFLGVTIPNRFVSTMIYREANSRRVLAHSAF